MEHAYHNESVYLNFTGTSLRKHSKQFENKDKTCKKEEMVIFSNDTKYEVSLMASVLFYLKKITI